MVMVMVVVAFDGLPDQLDAFIFVVVAAGHGPNMLALVDVALLSHLILSESSIGYIQSPLPSDLAYIRSRHLLLLLRGVFVLLLLGPVGPVVLVLSPLLLRVVEGALVDRHRVVGHRVVGHAEGERRCWWTQT